MFDPLPVAIDRPEATAAVVTFKAPLTLVAVRSPCSPVTVNPADPDKLKPILSASAVAVTVTVSVLKLSVIEVAAEPVVIAIVLSVASPVVTFSAPVSELAVILPISPLTDFCRRAHQRQRRIVGKRCCIDRHRIACAVSGDRGGGGAGCDCRSSLSVASPVVTVSAPVNEPAAISPTSPVTVSAADPVSVSAVFCASTAALTVTMSLAPLALIEVAAEPVVIVMPLSAGIARGHVQRAGE